MRENAPLFSYFRSLTDAKRLQLYHNHHLWGLAYVYPELFGLKEHSQAKERYLMQWHQNVKYQELAANICISSQNVVFLKGISLLDTIYTAHPGARFMSDIDVYIEDEEEHFALIRKLENLGLTPIVKRAWYGDNFKQEYVGKYKDVDAVVEVHRNLFFHREKFQYEKSNNFLTPEYQLVHLTTHYCLQHTMQKLYWFFDIALFLDHFENKINWQKCFEIARQWGSYNSFVYTLGAVKKFWNADLPCPIARFSHLIDEDFLFSDRRRSLKYQFLKNEFKDTWNDRIKYNFMWIKKAVQS